MSTAEASAPVPRSVAVPAVLTPIAIALLGIGLVLVADRVSPLAPIVLIVGIAAIPRIITRPDVALGMLVATELSSFGDVADSQGVPLVATFTLVLGCIATVLALRARTVRFTWSPIYLTLGAFLAVRAMTVLLAPQPGEALGHVTDVVRAVALLFIVAILASAPGAMALAARVGVATVAGIAAMSVAQEVVVGNGFEFWGFSRVPKLGDIGAATDRHAGPMSDANFWARTLVLFPAFALSLMAAARTRVARYAAAAAAGLIVIGVYLTGSRGGLITVALAIVAWMALAGGRPRRLLGLAPTVAVALVLLPGIGTRLATLSQLDDATEEAGDASLVGRVAVQRQGLEMFLDHPALGVGTTQFKDAEIDYLRRSGLTVARVLAPHNLYLEMAAEGGLAGLASWLLFYGTAVWVALRALLLSRAMAQDDPLLDRLLPVAVLAGLVAWATASIFLHLAGLRSLLLVIGLGVALDDRARRRATRGLRAAPSERRALSWKPLLVTAAVVVVAFALGAAPGLRTTGWSATARLQVVAADTDRAYDHDIATREHLRATLARLVETPGVWQGEVTATVDDSVQATADARTAFITVTGTAPDADRAVDLTIAARDAGIDRIRELDRLLELDALGEPVIARRSVRWDADSLRIGALVALIAYWSLVWARWVRSRWRGAPISIEPAVA